MLDFGTDSNYGQLSVVYFNLTLPFEVFSNTVPKTAKTSERKYYNIGIPKYTGRRLDFHARWKTCPIGENIYTRKNTDENFMENHTGPEILFLFFLSF